MADHRSAATLRTSAHHRDRMLYFSLVRVKASADRVHWIVERCARPRRYSGSAASVLVDMSANVV